MKLDDRKDVNKYLRNFMESEIYGFTNFKITDFTEIFELKFVLKDEIWAVIFEILYTILARYLHC